MEQQQNTAPASHPAHECALAQTRKEVGQLCRTVHQLLYRVVEAERKVDALAQELAQLKAVKMLER